MNERENFLKVLNGEQPEWIPYYRDACQWVLPHFANSYMEQKEIVDFLSVPWTLVDAGPMVDTTKPPVMEDISDWKDFVHLPDPDTYDWEAHAPAEMAALDPNKARSIPLGLGGGCYFIPLVNMMGFENGICALLEDPDSVNEMFEVFTDWYVRQIPYYVKYFDPDIITMGDDICTAAGPFFSYDLYEELFRPHYKRVFDAIIAAGSIPELHMCGKADVYISDFVDNLHIRMWQPAQPLNDLAGLKKKYGNSLVINGGWYTAGEGGVPGAPEDVVRKSARESMDLLGPGGGYIYWDGDPVGTSEDMKNKISWLADEARTYGRKFYQNK